MLFYLTRPAGPRTPLPATTSRSATRGTRRRFLWQKKSPQQRVRRVPRPSERDPSNHPSFSPLARGIPSMPGYLSSRHPSIPSSDEQIISIEVHPPPPRACPFEDTDTMQIQRHPPLPATTGPPHFHLSQNLLYPWLDSHLLTSSRRQFGTHH